jgi:hypothetical protein
VTVEFTPPAGDVDAWIAEATLIKVALRQERTFYRPVAPTPVWVKAEARVP